MAKTTAILAEPRTRCTECGREWDCDEDVPMLYDAERGEHYHGCPICGTDDYLMDIPCTSAAA